MYKERIIESIKDTARIAIAIDIATEVITMATNECPEILAKAIVIVMTRHEKTIKELWPNASIQEKDNQTT